MSDSLQPHGLQQARLPCPLPTPRACSNSCPLSPWCHPTISSSAAPSCLQSFPAPGSFQMSQFFTKYWSFSFSISLCNEYSRLISFENESEICSVMSTCLWPHGLYSRRNSPGQNAGVSSLSLLQGSFPTQGSNPGLLHCKWILYQLRHKGSPRILEWVAYPFSSESSQSRNWTRVSCIAGGFFTNWAIREAPLIPERPCNFYM